MPTPEWRQRVLTHPLPWAAALVAVLTWRLTLFTGEIQAQADALVYRAGVQACWSGGEVYAEPLIETGPGGGSYFTYPPFALPLLAPFNLLSWQAAAVVLGVASAVALVWWVHTFLAAMGPGPSPLGLVLAIAVLAACTVPFLEHVRLGQVNIFLLLLCTADLVRPPGRVPRGVLLGIAIGIKITPAALLLLPLLAKEWRTLVVSGLTAFATIASGWAIVPGEAGFYWTEALTDTERVGLVRRAANQSVRAVVERFASGEAALWLWAGLCLLFVAAVAWLLTRGGLLREDRSGAFAVTALLPVVLSPVAWTHHWVWFFPAIVWLVVRGWQQRRRWWWRTGLLVWGALVAYPLAAFEPARHRPGSRQYDVLLAAGAGAYVYAALIVVLVVLATTGTASRRRHDESPAHLPG